jgi:hypothetical protein
MKRCIVCFLIFVLPLTGLTAQSMYWKSEGKRFFVNDYVVTADSDTVRGELKKLSWNLGQGLTVVMDKDGEEITFRRLEVKSFQLQNVIYVVKHQKRNPMVKGNAVPMRLMQSGKLTLFDFGQSGVYYVELEDGTSLRIDRLVKYDFKKYLVPHLRKCTAFVNKYPGKLRIHQTVEMVTFYNENCR